jgi:hypothetical protein
LLAALPAQLAQSYRAAHAVIQFGVNGFQSMAWYVALFSADLFGKNAWETEQGRLILLLRDILGNPFCPRVIDPHWLTWNDGTVAKLAENIYAERTFDRLPILADALEEAGCTDADILGHCRSDGPHARGCWVIDLLLGKK